MVSTSYLNLLRSKCANKLIHAFHNVLRPPLLYTSCLAQYAQRILVLYPCLEIFCATPSSCDFSLSSARKNENDGFFSSPLASDKIVEICDTTSFGIQAIVSASASSFPFFFGASFSYVLKIGRAH